MKITCAILCYNYGRYLKQAIESCLNQTSGSYEIEVIVIDDGSTDNTPIICQEYINVIKSYRSVNEGFERTLTKAIEYATGDYICLLDADDYFVKDKIIRMLPYINLQYLFIKHGQYYMDTEGNLIKNGTIRGGNTSTLTIQREAALTLLPAENELFFHPLFDAGLGIELTDPLTYYRFHTSNMTNRKDPGVWYTYLAHMTVNLTKILKKNKSNFFWTNEHKLDGIINTYESLSYYNFMEASVQLGNRYDALKKGLCMLHYALYSQRGITLWHLKVFVRCVLQMRTMKEYASVNK